MARGFDVFKKPGDDRKFEVPKDAPAGTYGWFGPPDTTERFKFARDQGGGGPALAPAGNRQVQEGPDVPAVDRGEGRRRRSSTSC